ncbi:MAG: hypothetical protein IKG77_01290, partial [Prevotella sp.]|nr:hypothetical protein [Prevotella sp.]
MKQKTVILLMLVAFVLMWACTPSSLHRDNNREVAKAVGVSPLPDAMPLDTLVERIRENAGDSLV